MAFWGVIGAAFAGRLRRTVVYSSVQERGGERVHRGRASAVGVPAHDQGAAGEMSGQRCDVRVGARS